MLPLQPMQEREYGDHIAVTGKWVQDVGHSTAPHEAWNEIHPAAKVEKIP